MSQFYEMSVEISGYAPAKAKEIQEAAEAEWPLEDWWSATDQPGEMMHASAQSSLCGGEESFVERLSVAIWRANGSYCNVTVDATYLENLPYETHSLDESDYARLTQSDHNPDTRRTEA